MKPPSRLTPSGPMARLMSWLNELLDYVKTLEVRETPSVKPSRNTKGTFLKSQGSGGTGSGSDGNVYWS